MKRLLSLLGLFMIAISSFSQTFTVDGLEYSINIKTAQTVTLINGKNAVGDVSVPLSVTYEDREYTVTSIGERAFSGTPSLTSISSHSVTTIERNAFENCSSLASVAFPSATKIKIYAFYACNSLTSISLPSVATLGNDAFENCSSLTSVSLPSVTAIQADAFSGCSSLTSVSLPSVNSIGIRAFRNCSSLASVSLPSVTTLESNAFSGCSNLQNIYISDLSKWCGVQGLEFLMKEGVSSKKLYVNDIEVKDVALPEDVTIVSSYVFYGLSSLSSVSMPSVTTIQADAFSGCSSLTSVSLPSVDYIGVRAFRNCSSLASVSLPSVTTLGSNAFSGCSNLQNIYISDLSKWCGVQGLEFLMKEGVSSKKLYVNDIEVKDVALPEDVTIVSSYVFYGLSSLSSVSMPSVTTIQADAFSGCSSLTSVSLPSVTTLESEAFYGCSKLQNIYISDLSKWCGVQGLEFLMKEGSSSKKLYVNNIEVTTELNIPEGTTVINPYAFYCLGIKDVSVPSTITSMSGLAFNLNSAT